MLNKYLLRIYLFMLFISYWIPLGYFVWLLVWRQLGGPQWRGATVGRCQNLGLTPLSLQPESQDYEFLQGHHWLSFIFS